MAAFLNTGRSDSQKHAKSNGSYRPEEDAWKSSNGNHSGL
jgi:hypothetical protein